VEENSSEESEESNEEFTEVKSSKLGNINKVKSVYLYIY
jgi:hypothetical protein